MTDKPEAQAEGNQDTSQPEGGLQIEFADEADKTQPDLSAEGQGEGAETTPPPPEWSLGKFESPEQLAKAYQEVEKTMHERSEEAATYRKALESINTQTTQQQATPQAGPDMDAVNDQFRAFAEQNPIGAIEYVAEQIVNRRDQAKQEMQTGIMSKFNELSANPIYKGVAPTVMQQMALNPQMDVEKAFMAETIKSMAAGAQTQAVSQQAQSQRMHVETGSSRQSDNTLRIEVDPDAHRLRGAFGDLQGGKEWEDLNVRAAKLSQIKQSPKAPVTIADWQKAGGK